MTSLANQLKALATPHSHALLGDERRRVSLLFDPNEAATLDKDALFAIGVSGLEEMIEINSVFLEYEKTLFNESATNLQRLVQDAEVNKQLDEMVKSYLVYLSPYLLLRPAQKTLEWLVYRYQIHTFNMDDLLMAAFPYHDSNLFTRLIQIFNLSNPKSKWHWIEPIQKHGTQLPCQTIATHAYRDEGFLNFVASIPDQFIRVHGHGVAGQNSPVHTAISFYVKILLSCIDQATNLKESFIAQTSVYLMKGLKSKNIELKCASYMILSALCGKVQLDKSFLESVLGILTKRMSTSCGFEAVSAVVFMFKTQLSLRSLPRRSFKHMCRLPGIVQHLTQLDEWGVLDSLWPHLISHLVPAAIKDCRVAVTSSSDGGLGEGSELTPGKPEYWSMLESLLTDCHLSDDNARLVVRLMCTEYASNKPECHTEESSKLLADTIQAMLRLIENKYSSIVDAEIKEQMNSSTEDGSIMQEFAMMSISSFKYQGTDKGTNLVLALNHAKPAVRKHGVESLIESLTSDQNDDSIDKEFVTQSLQSRLIDGDESVSRAMAAAPSEILTKYLTAHQLISAITKSALDDVVLRCCDVLAHHHDSSNAASSIQKLVLSLTEREQYESVRQLVMNLNLPLLQGFDPDVPHAVMKSVMVNCVARNLVKSEDVSDELENLFEIDTEGIGSASLLCISMDILIKALNDVNLKLGSKSLLLTQLLDTFKSLLTEMPANQVTDNLVHKIASISSIFIEGTFSAARGDWYKDSNVTVLYISYISLLMKHELVQVIPHLVSDWMKNSVLDQVLSVLLSGLSAVCCLNLLHICSAMIKARNDCKQILARDDSKTLACLISLLASEHKLIRSHSLKMLSALASVQNQKSCAHKLAQQLLTRKEEIKSDMEHLRQAVPLIIEERRDVRLYLVNMITDVDTPVPMACRLIQALSLYDDYEVLVGLLPLIERLLNNTSCNAELLSLALSRYNVSSSNQLPGEKRAWNLFIKALKSAQSQRSAIELITKPFYSGLDNTDCQHTILSLLLDIYQQSEDAKLHSFMSKIVRKLSLRGEVVQKVMSQLNANVSGSADQTMKAKRSRRSQVVEIPANLSSDDWSKLKILLEWLQNKKKITDSHLLLPDVHRHMALLLEMHEEAGIDYMKHLLLGTTDMILLKLSTIPDQDLVPGDAINIEMVIQCLRTSTNPQTHQQALLVLKSAAALFPDVVLHHVMPIFTYMGTNIMRQDDMYSFQIISKTLDTVIPELVKASSDTAEQAITGIIRVFIDAYQFIPEHRRLPLFVKLMDTLGVQKYLDALTCLSVESYIKGKSNQADPLTDAEQQNDSSQMHFLLSLYSQFSADDQTVACTKLLNYHYNFLQKQSSVIQSSPSKLKRKSARAEKAERTRGKAEALFDISQHTDKQLRHYQYECIVFITSLLSSSTYIEQVVNDNEEAKLSSSFNRLLEAGLKYISSVARECESHAQQPTYKFWRALLHKSYEVLDKVNGLLPGSVFLNAVASLLKHDMPLVRRKAMDLLNNRLPQTEFTSSELDALQELMVPIKSIALNLEPAVSTEADEGVNRQTALFSLKIIARVLANHSSSPFIKLLDEVASAFVNVMIDAVKANMLLLIGELVSHLKIQSVPMIPQVMPLIISTLQEDGLMESNNLLWISGITALQKVVQSIPNFLSQYLLDIVILVCKQSGLIINNEQQGAYKSQLPTRLKALRDTLAKEFAPRVIIPILHRSYSELKNKYSVQSLMSIVSQHVEHMSKEDLSSNHHKLLDLLILCLGYRASNDQLHPSAVEETEDSIIAASMKMIVRLSESTFRPMYLKLYGWATRESENANRLITFYRLSDRVADKLKGLFSLFASHIVKNAADILKVTSNTKEDGSRYFGSEPHQVSKEYLLSTSVLDCLHKCFKHDSDGFVTKQRFNILMEPIVDQLERRFDGYETYIKSHVIPCVSQLAVAAGDDALWKPLIYQVCLKTRNDNPEVRKSSLHLLRDLNSKLGEDFMTLLPETIPFLAELMEDDEEEVETLCQEVIADMEKILGEPLQKYF